MSDDPEILAARGAQAEMELRETEKAFDSLRQGFLETIAKSGMEEAPLREKCYLGVTVIDGVKALLIAVAGNKAIAQHDEMIRDILAGKAE